MHAHALAVGMILFGLVLGLGCLVSWARHPRYVAARARARVQSRHAAPLTGRRQRLRQARATRARLTP